MLSLLETGPTSHGRGLQSHEKSNPRMQAFFKICLWGLLTNTASAKGSRMAKLEVHGEGSDVCNWRRHDWLEANPLPICHTIFKCGLCYKNVKVS